MTRHDTTELEDPAGRPCRVLVSSCLLGMPVRYDGESAMLDNPDLARWIREGRVVPVCPEILGGLGVPREPAEIVGGDGADVLSGRARVVTPNGTDVTDAFVAGALQVVALAGANGASVAILKQRSPSCGSRGVYDGTFSRTLMSGRGVTVAALEAAGVRVYDETQVGAAAAIL